MCPVARAFMRARTRTSPSMRRRCRPAAAAARERRQRAHTAMPRRHPRSSKTQERRCSSRRRSKGCPLRSRFPTRTYRPGCRHDHGAARARRRALCAAAAAQQRAACVRAAVMPCGAFLRARLHVRRKCASSHFHAPAPRTQGADGMAYSYAPFSPPYYVRAHTQAHRALTPPPTQRIAFRRRSLTLTLPPLRAAFPLTAAVSGGVHGLR
jgi:hypothetical protein